MKPKVSHKEKHIVLYEPDAKTVGEILHALEKDKITAEILDIGALKSAPHLLLLSLGAAALKDSWKKCLADLKHFDRLPVLGFTRSHLDKRRSEGVIAGCDNVITLDALLNHPRWQIDLHARPLQLGNARKPLPQGVVDGIQLFNERKFHEAHDAIEAVWLHEKKEVRLLYQGILQAGIAYYHIEKDRYEVALRMFIAAQAKIRHFLPSFQGVDLAKLANDMKKGVERLQKLGPDRMRSFPQTAFPKIYYQSPSE